MNATIVFSGINILQSHQDILQPADLYDLFGRITGDQALKEEVIRLRKISQVDMAAYHRVKTRLPYFCCAGFTNGIRKSENFITIALFVIDLDKVGPAMLEELKKKLAADPRVKMYFTSPGGKGLKVVFELSEPCVSLKQYSDFYRTFAYHLMETYQLQENLDASTCDATRVTFLSHDPEAYYNSLNEPVIMCDYLPLMLLPDSPKESGVIDPESKEERPALPEELYKEILLKLNPGARINKPKKQIYVPEILHRIKEPIEAEFTKMGVLVKEIRDIQYGKKFIFTLGHAMGEVNLFYGQRGFSVVQSPKAGSDPKLNEIGEMVIRKVLTDRKPKDVSTAVNYTLN